MQTQYMKVNPSEMVIDLPVDEAKVQELMASIQSYGLLQAPNVWLKEMRTIDGFHRIVACQRLGLSEIDCIVIDCDDSAFWDARIIAAKPHSTISDARLGAWIVESWKASEFYEEPDLEKAKSDYGLFGMEINPDNDFLIRFSAASQIWNNDFSDKIIVGKQEAHSVERWKNGRTRDVTRITPIVEERELSAVEKWFMDKATKWGVGDVKQSLLNALGFPSMPEDRRELFPFINLPERVENGLSLVEARAIVVQATGFSREETQEWIEKVRETGEPKTFRDYRRTKYQEEREQKDAKLKAEAEKREQDRLRRDQWEKTRAGQAKLEKERKQEVLSRFERQMESVFDALEYMEIDSIEQAPSRLASLIDAIENKIALSFPDHLESSRVNPVIKENIELHKKIIEQEYQIESLTRALDSKQYASGRLPDTQALSSTHIEAMQ